MNEISFEWDENKSLLNKKRNMAYHLKRLKRYSPMKMLYFFMIPIIHTKKIDLFFSG